MMKHKKRSHGDKLVQDKTSDDRGIKDETTIKQEVGEASQKNNHENIKSKSLNCDSCDKSFKTSNQLKQHQLTHLPDSEKPFQCEICLIRFCQKGQKIVHMKKKHSSDYQIEENVEVSVELNDTINESEDTSDNNTNLENETIDEIENLSESVVDNFDFE